MPTRQLTDSTEVDSTESKHEVSASSTEELNSYLIAQEQVDRAVALLPDLKHGLIEFLKTPDRAVHVSFPVDSKPLIDDEVNCSQMASGSTTSRSSDFVRLYFESLQHAVQLAAMDAQGSRGLGLVSLVVAKNTDDVSSFQIFQPSTRWTC